MAKDRKDSKARLLKVAATIYLTPEQADTLRRLSEATMIPQQALMRQGVDMMLEARKKEVPKK